MQFRVLGPVEAEIGGKLVPLPRRRERCLLGVLLLETSRVVSVDRLAELLWDGTSPKRVRSAIQGHVSRLRAALGAAGGQDIELAYVADGYRLLVDVETVDAHRFRALLDRAADTRDLADRAELLRAALDLWRGPALADAVGGLLRQRLCSDLEEQRLTAIEDLASAMLTLQREREILPELARIAGENRGRESLVALHMRALYQAGRRVDALDVFARARVYLADELGLDPGPELRELHHAILRDERPAVSLVNTASTGSANPGQPVLQVAPRQLPADIPSFTGRSKYLEQLDSLLPRRGAGATSVVISTISGTAGVGKTALAVHWAHRVVDHFPDGQLYVNLRGFDPANPPMAPAEAVRVLLDALEVPPHRIPGSLDAQVGLYRSLLAGRRILVVLDNVRYAEQVRPLLPGSAGCLAIVTSRTQLDSLAVLENASVLTLDVLTATEARQLLERRIGVDRLVAEANAAEEIVRRCAGLPLALAIVAARAATNRNLSLQELADDFKHAASSLDAITNSDAMADVRSVLSWSYHALQAEPARLFRLLGLHPGPDLTVRTAASLAGHPLPRARALMAELVTANLVAEPVPGRYALHDLLRAYAAELVSSLDAPQSTREASHRMLDHYLHAAHAAALLIGPHRPPLTLSPPVPGVVVMELGDHQQAMAWLSSERSALVRLVEHAACNRFDVHAWQLAWCFADFLHRRGQLHQHISTQQVALQCAERLADGRAEAAVRNWLGTGYARAGEYDEARKHHRRATDLYAGYGDQAGQARSLFNIVWLDQRQGNHDDAIGKARSAHALFASGGNHAGAARCLNAMGWSYALLGDYQNAIFYCKQALAVEEQIGDEAGAGDSWDSLGYAYQHLGDHQQAIACYQRALDSHDRCGERRARAFALSHLGDAYLQAGEPDAARDQWRAAVEAFDELGASDVNDVRAKLERLPTAADQRVRR